MKNNIKILLIDDNKTFLLITEALLKKDEIITDKDTLNTLTSVSELSEKELLDLTQYDVIICDYNLEERLTGLDFLKILDKFKFIGLKILLTSDESYDLHARIRREDIKYVTKNINIGEHSTNSILGDIIKKYRNSTI
jgi:CheY-like chemotaxis protein